MASRSPFLILTCDDGSVDLALRELKAAAPKYVALATLAPGVLLVDAAQPAAELASHWAASPPVFVRHICPAVAITALDGDVADVSRLADFLCEGRESLAAAIDPMLSFSVQTRLLVDLPYKPFDVNNALAERAAMVAGALLDVRSPQQVLSVVCATLPVAAAAMLGARGVHHPPHFDGQFALLGVSAARHNLSSWAGGMRRFAREEGQISRAEFKLLEALEIFGIELPPHGVALDLGASPGGWTRVLRQRDQYVTAVDPGELDPRLATDRGVRHKRLTAEEYLRSEPDQFDLIVNDMRMDGRDSARLMVAFARQLYPHGFVLMTLKLPEAKREPVLDQAFHILRQVYDIVGARQLFHNRSEITLYLRPRSTSARS